MPHTSIRSATRADEDAIWSIFLADIAGGDAYVFDADTRREDVLAYWFGHDTHTYIAECDGQPLATYIVRPNRPGLGAHVANAAFIVAPAARRLGIGKRMGEHCLAEARRLGFRAMQFNFVISTNEAAIRLWQQLGFRIIGTLPEAFRHARYGFVDAYVMFQKL